MKGKLKTKTHYEIEFILCTFVNEQLTKLDPRLF